MLSILRRSHLFRVQPGRQPMQRRKGGPAFTLDFAALSIYYLLICIPGAVEREADRGRDVAQSCRAQRSGRWSRRFKSSHPDHLDMQALVHMIEYVPGLFLCEGPPDQRAGCRGAAPLHLPPTPNRCRPITAEERTQLDFKVRFRPESQPGAVAVPPDDNERRPAA